MRQTASIKRLNAFFGPVARRACSVPFWPTRLVSRDRGNDGVPVSQIIICRRNADFLWFRSTEPRSPQPVAFEAVLAGGRTLRGMPGDARFHKVPRLAKPPRISTRNDERRIVTDSHWVCPKHIRWPGSAKRFERYVGPFPTFPPSPAARNTLASRQVRPITERT